MAWGQIAAIAAPAILGAIAGGQGSRSTQTTERSLGPMSEQERRGGQVALDQLNLLEDWQRQYGPGAADVYRGTESQRDLASMLQQFAQGGFQPSQADITGAQSLAQQLFQGQQTGLNQAFEDQRRMASRNAARAGRAGLDPVLQNLLAQGQTRQQNQLNADIGSYATQYALSLPQQRLGFQQQLADVRSGLATQAMQNRQALLGLGSQLQNQQQQFRLGSASTTQTSFTPGGTAGALTGALGGASAGMSLAKGFGGK